jgi:hypothetical protein
VTTATTYEMIANDYDISLISGFLMIYLHL